MRLKRPYIPIAVRIAVAERQLAQRVVAATIRRTRVGTRGSERLKDLLTRLFGEQPVHLDHDPPLMLRRFSERTGLFTPRANDPNYLIWRSAEEHRIKTFVRGDGAQFSDAAKRRREIKRKRGRRIKRSKRRWPTRKLRSRPMRKPWREMST